MNMSKVSIKYFKLLILLIYSTGHLDCASLTTQFMGICSSTDWPCEPGVCIPLYQLCDGLAQCSDSSDESKCEKSGYNCDFNHGDSITDCGWKMTESYGTHWLHMSSADQGKSVDRCLYLGNRVYKSDKITSVLVGPTFHSGQCHMTLQYSIMGPTAQLEISIRKEIGEDELLATLNQHETDAWRTDHFYIKVDESYQIILSGTVSSTDSVRINFIKFSPNCPSGSELILSDFPGFQENTSTNLSSTATTNLDNSTATSETEQVTFSTISTQISIQTIESSSSEQSTEISETSTKFITRQELITESSINMDELWATQSPLIRIKNSGLMIPLIGVAVCVLFLLTIVFLIGYWNKQRKFHFRFIINKSYESSQNISMERINSE